MAYTNLDFVEFLYKMLGMPYWYGTCVYKCTQSVLNSKSKQYPSHYTSSRMSKYKDAIEKRLVSADCVGLGKGYLWTNGGQGVIESIGTTKTFKRGYATNGCPDKSANGMFTYAKSKGLKWGKIDTIPEILGLAVRYDGHVGFYVGNGEVIEARGFKYGIVKTKLAGRKWDHWYEFPGITYVVNGEIPEPPKPAENPDNNTYAYINTNGGRLNMRTSKSLSASVITKISNGTKVILLEKDSSWSKISYSNKIGYVVSHYLKFEGEKEPIKEYELGQRLPLSIGMKGPDVKELQEILEDLGYKLEKYGADGDFGSETETQLKAFQKDVNLIADGILTQTVLTALQKNQGDDDPADKEEEDKKEINYDFSQYPTIRKNDENDYVTILQTYLKQLGYDLGAWGEAKDGIDGEYGAKTQAAVRALQKKANIKVDGICGPNTWDALAKALA